MLKIPPGAQIMLMLAMTNRGIGEVPSLQNCFFIWKIRIITIYFIGMWVKQDSKGKCSVNLKSFLLHKHLIISKRAYYMPGTMLSITFINSFNPHNGTKCLLLLSSFYRQGSRGLQWLSDLRLQRESVS